MRKKNQEAASSFARLKVFHHRRGESSRGERRILRRSFFKTHSALNSRRITEMCVNERRDWISTPAHFNTTQLSCFFRRSLTFWLAAVDVTGMITDTVLILTLSQRCRERERERSAPKMVQKSKCDIITESVTFEPQQILYLEAFFILGYHRFSIFVSVKSFRWSLSRYKCVRCTNSHWSWWKRHVLSLCFSSFTPLPFPDSAFDSSSSSALISFSLVSFACPLLASSPPPPLPSIFFFYFPSAQISIICFCRREDKSSSVCAELPLLYKEIKTCCVSVSCLDVYIDLFVYK